MFLAMLFSTAAGLSALGAVAAGAARSRHLHRRSCCVGRLRPRAADAVLSRSAPGGPASRSAGTSPTTRRSLPPSPGLWAAWQMRGGRTARDGDHRRGARHPGHLRHSPQRVGLRVQVGPAPRRRATVMTTPRRRPGGPSRGLPCPRRGTALPLAHRRPLSTAPSSARPRGGRTPGRPHAGQRHVGRTDDDLRDRLAQQPGISAASTYTDRATAERVIGDDAGARTRAGRPLVGPHRLAPESRARLHGPAGRRRSAGRCGAVTRRVLPCTDAIVVLRWDARRGYYVLTSYPERRR